MWFCCALLLKSLFQSPLYQRELALTSTPDGKSTALSPSAHPPSLCLFIYLTVTFSLSVWALNRLEGVSLLLSHICTNTHTHTHIGLSGVSPESLGYSGWHVSLIHYWSDPAAIIYRSLRDTPLSLSHTHYHTPKRTCLLAHQLIYFSQMSLLSHCHLKIHY